MPSTISSAKNQSLKKSGRKAHVATYVEKGLRQAMRGQTDSTVLYHSAFPIGEAIATIVAYRLANGERPVGLMATIEEMLGGRLPNDTPEEAARRGMLCGLCWSIQTMLRMGSMSGFRFQCDDERQILDEGLRESKASARIVQETMNSRDEED